VEDVLGVLVDMDLLEMKFFLNGVDLGTAFVNFSCNGLYPALSLNVRQCLRVNFGQERFIYPPTVVDGLPFRSVLEAIKSNKDKEEKKKFASASTAASTASAGTTPAKTAAASTTAVASAGRSALTSEEMKVETTASGHQTSASLFPSDVISSHDQQQQQPHGGGGSRVGGVRLGLTGTGEIPHRDEDRNPIEDRIIPIDSTTDDDNAAALAAAAAANRRAAGEEGEGNEVSHFLSLVLIGVF
jgi:hypothetical protein